MPLMYYGNIISDNITQTPEGFVIAKNVPIGRTGGMVYLGQEIGLTDQANEKITAYRTAEELFSPAAIASFEGKSITDGHPQITPSRLDQNNYSQFEKGHIENVRRGGVIDEEGNEALVADLVIKDAALANEVLDGGKRQVSCGYDSLFKLGEDGNVYQIKIRGNHLAVVDIGRGGPAVAIKDEQPEGGIRANRLRPVKPLERSIGMADQKKLKGIASLLGWASRNAQTEEDMQSIVDNAAAVLDEATKAEEPAKDNPVKDEGVTALDALTQSVKDIGEKLAALEAKVNTPATEEKTALDKLVEEFSGEEAAGAAPTDESGAAGQEAVTVAAETMDESAIISKDAAAHLITKLRPAIAALPSDQQKTIVDSLSAALRGTQEAAKNPFAEVMQATRASAKKTMGDYDPMAQAETTRKLHAARNPHTKEYMEAQKAK